MGNICKRKTKDEDSRTIYPTTSFPQDSEFFDNPNNKFANNSIKTTKYTLITFIPLNLYEQLHRFANCYFIFIVILNFMPKVEAFAKEVAAIPVLAVLSLTAVKDAFEDFRRYIADQKVNKTLTKVYSAKIHTYVEEEWANLKPGDWVRLQTNEAIPADVLLLKSSDISGMCHIETSNLDGESNLKQRNVVKMSTSEEFSPDKFTWPVNVEAPNADLNKFSGSILSPQPKIVRKNNLLLRGCILRNTDFIEGLIIYAGKETKASLNNSGRKFKRSKLEKRINKDIIWCVLILAIVCLIGSVGFYIWRISFPGVGIFFLAGNDVSDASLNAFINLWTFVIIFQAIIPLPLYVTIEFVKLMQSWFIAKDLEIYDAERDKPTEVHAFNIPEDLGQIEYVFSDKTGTLTENKMIFRRAIINGVDYWTDFGEVSFESWSTTNNGASIPNVDLEPSRLSSVQNLLKFKSNDEKDVQEENCSRLAPGKMIQPAHSAPYLHTLHEDAVETEKEDVAGETEEDSAADESVSFADSCQQHVQDFFLCLTICNSVVVSANKNSTVPIVSAPPKKRFSRFRKGGFDNGHSSRIRRFFQSSGKGDNGEGPQRVSGVLRSSRSLSSLFHWRRSAKEVVGTDDCLHSVFARDDPEVPRVELDSHRRSISVPRSGQPNADIESAGGAFLSRVLSVVHESPKSSPPIESKHFQKNIGQPPPLLSCLCGPPTNDEDEQDASSDDDIAKASLKSSASSTEVIAVELANEGTSASKTKAGGDDEIYRTQDIKSWINYSLLNHECKAACPLSDQVLLTGYESESPDEVALVRTACQYGCKLLQRGDDFIIIWLPGSGVVRIELLHVLPFDSDRKRMSVIVRNPATDEIVIYTKGADSVILKRLNSARDGNLVDKTEKYLQTYSHHGLRTLVMAKRVISEKEYRRWSAAYNSAEISYKNSDELKAQLMEGIEVNLELLGATGIEDKLQEGVPDTIASLREAGMKVWVLTGDKRETAISIAYAAKLITDDHKVITLDPSSPEEAILRITEILGTILTNPGGNLDVSSRSATLPGPSNARASHYEDNLEVVVTHNSSIGIHAPCPRISIPVCMPSYGDDRASMDTPVKLQPQISKCEEALNLVDPPPRLNNQMSRISILDRDVTVEIPADLALVLTGDSLDYLLDDSVRSLFLRLAKNCSSLIICRATPSQKALVVTTVKCELGALTLAIGDGANDVNMIQCANVGVGISGQEGMQAVMASDFAISRFSFLKRLLLVHGFFCYEKLARMALYMFYKDAVYIFSLFWYQFFNGYSGSVHIDQVSQTLFNVTMTSLPPFVLGIFDKPLDQSTLIANPKIYKSGQKSMTYKPYHFWINTFDAVWQSLVIFFIPFSVYWDSNVGMQEMGMTCLNILVVVSLLHISLETKYFTLIHFAVYIGSYLIAFLGCTLLYQKLGVTQVQPDPPFNALVFSMGTNNFWLCLLLCTPLALLPRVLMNSLSHSFTSDLNSLAARLEKKYCVGARLPIDRFTEDHGTHGFLTSLNQAPTLYSTDSPSFVSDSGDPTLVEIMDSAAENIRSTIWRWFSSGGRLIARMPVLRRRSNQPLLRHVSVVGTSIRPESAPNTTVDLVDTLPNIRTRRNVQRGHQRSSTYGGSGGIVNHSFRQSDCTVGELTPLLSK